MNFFSTLPKNSQNELAFIANLKVLKTECQHLVSNLQKTTNLIVRTKENTQSLNPTFTSPQIFQKHHCLNAISKIQHNLKIALEESDATYESFWVENNFVSEFLLLVKPVVRDLLQIDDTFITDIKNLKT